MRSWPCAVVLVTLAMTGWRGDASQSEQSPVLTPARAAAVEQDVRAFTRDVARDVTAQGPIAWKLYFEDSPAFFMAVNGKIAFSSGSAALAGLPNVAQMYKHIDLQWGDDLRVDPLTPTLACLATSWHEVVVDAQGRRTDTSGFFTGVAEYQGGRWRFRNAHWSTIVPNVS